MPVACPGADCDIPFLDFFLNGSQRKLIMASVGENNSDQTTNFDGLLGSIDIPKLEHLLSITVESRVKISGPNIDVATLPDAEQGWTHLKIHSGEEVVAWISSNSSQEKLAAVTKILEILFYHVMRYEMASKMLLDTLQDDYERLEHQHDALLKSETRYKDLSSQLEQRVAEQVETIESTQRKLYQTEKMASVGQLAAGVAHEINTPIGFIKSNLNTAKKYIADFSEFAKLLEKSDDLMQVRTAWQQYDLDETLNDMTDLVRESHEGAARIANIVTDLKTTSNLDKSEEDSVDLNNIVQSACNLMKGKFDGRAEIKLQLGNLPLVHCHPGKLGQLCQHLLLNAYQALTSCGEISVTTNYVEDEIHMIFRDNGCGIEKEIQDKVFEPFFTTHDVGVGTGLGLTICRDVALAHDGRLEVESEVGSGTRVELIFPAII